MKLNYSILCVILSIALSSGSIFAQSIKAPAAPKPPIVKAPAPPPPPEFLIDQNEALQVVEEMPRFPGCEDMGGTEEEIKECAQARLIEYISNNLHYPIEAKKEGISGMVLVQYVVTAEGGIDKINVIRDIGGGCGQAGAAVFEKMQEDGIVWIPGKEQGKAVPVQLTIPIKFEL